MAVWFSCFHHLRPWSVVIDPVNAELSIELGPEARGKETVAKQSSRRIQNEYDELRFGDGKAMGTSVFGQPADHGVHVFDVVNHRPIGVSQAVVDRRAVG